MESFTPRRTSHNGPEAQVQQDIIKFLRNREWFVKSTHGNMYQSGFPDLYCCHSIYKERWVEVKLPNMKGSRFTNAQLDTFPKLCANGSGVWIMTAATESEYSCLFRSPNWYQYLKM